MKINMQSIYIQITKHFFSLISSRKKVFIIYKRLIIFLVPQNNESIF